MKRVNENTIRVVLEADDLEDRGITMLDLLGNQGQIESFFYSILEEVDQEHTFSKSDAVTFQVMPNSSGLELLISKAGIPSVQKQSNKTEQSELTRREILQGLDQTSQQNTERLTEIKDEPQKVDLARVYYFEEFDQLVNLASELKVNGLTSSLRVYDDVYYLELFFQSDDFSELTASDAWVISNEFGTQIKSEYLDFREDAKLLMDDNALENIRYYFS